MLPGKTNIRTCAACSQLIEQPTIASGNTFGARYWTDGKIDAPMLPVYPWLVVCPHCNALLWIDEQQQIGELAPWDRGNAFPEARIYRDPSFEEYLRMLDKNLVDHKKECYLRVQAWHAGNDLRRNGEQQPLTADEITNLEALAAILDQANDEERLLKAEIMRELAQFEQALQILDKPFADKQVKSAAIIKKLAKQKKAWVAEVK